ncbi:uncharacterized protein J7T54_004467 [Emericellopsis cladophorae]|uniref:Methyltransferase domain-containing protein n=1 Tax=Emericellopsis cladophorae TaxID=2686198 RepID=A0A9Q0BG84_9HYPO|nr:uncharacterized protein J7T54_004467 [Emericellopsis cladophorae]KAI6783440.1 hypothetical protein J7T54_004467 [Emericellopsis cladophorae]
MMHKFIILLTAFPAGLLILLLYSRMSTSVEQASPPPPPFQHVSRHTHDKDLDARLSRAEAIWRQAAQDRKVMAEQMGYNRKFPDGYINPYHVWDFARPSFSCPHELERVGKLGDGGKVVCGMSRYEKESPGPSVVDNPNRELVIYSFGVSRDSTFEAAMLRRTNARIWGYDYSVNHWGEGIPNEGHSRANFTKMGIGKTTHLDWKPPMSTIHDLMKFNGHTFIDIVKMDIEGAEFDALASVIQSVLEGGLQHGNASLPFGQLLLEVHFMKEPKGFSIPQDPSSWLTWWASLEKMGLRPVNNEDNWIGDAVHGKPRFMEYTLINVFERDRNMLLW